MVSFLLTISYILHIVMIFIVLLLIFQIRKLKVNDSKMITQKKEIEGLLSSYLMELQEENEKFLNNIKKSEQNNKKNEKHQKISYNTNYPVTYGPSYKKTPVQAEKSMKHSVEKTNHQANRSIQESQTNHEYSPPTPIDDDRYIQSEDSRVFLLHGQGYSVDEIAKKLNRGKTEIELLLKFRQKS